MSGYVGTIGGLIRGGYRLWLTCQAPAGPRGTTICGHAQQLDLVALALAHGEGLSVQALVERARCGRCGARGRAVPTTYALETEGMGLSRPRDHHAAPRD